MNKPEDAFVITITEECIVPQGAKGFDEIYNIVSKYPNFDFSNVIKSMTCAGNAEFHLWSRV